jgi:hypothetical protein
VKPDFLCLHSPNHSNEIPAINSTQLAKAAPLQSYLLNTKAIEVEALERNKPLRSLVIELGMATPLL